MTPTKIALNKASILIADEDSLIAEILKNALYHMKLTNVTIVKSAEEVLRAIIKKPFDILITEWEMKTMSGIELVKAIRNMQDAKHALLPVIMLTARAQKVDVIEARDAGATEFLVKPFTTKTLYNRLEHIIEFPRDFIVAAEFVGHDRRRRKVKAETQAESRKMLPTLIADPKKINHVGENQRPYRILASHALKSKMGILDSLDKIITLQVLEEAQAAIAAFEEESLSWIGKDLLKLELALKNLTDTQDENALEIAKETLLSLKSRAGTFDFMIASEMAFSFYCFLRNKYSPLNKQHSLIIRKHLEVIKIILAKQVKGMGGPVEQQLMDGLSLLTQKLQDMDLV
jgi:two-component system chemotaxis response regulator CheY